MIYRACKPLLFRLDPEQAHGLANRLLQLSTAVPAGAAVLRRLFSTSDPLLHSELAGIALPNPIGLAAGYDKNGALLGGLATLGFGALEVGTVTPRPQAGNPRPRLFRLPSEQALINRLGFNNAGMLAVAGNLRRAAPYSLPLGVNIGKNRDTPLAAATADYLAAFYALAPLADYVVINVSSPNTPGLRTLQQQGPLRELLLALGAANRTLRRPVFVKVSPDESPAALDALLDTALSCGVAGLIATNTTTSREGLRSHYEYEAGGLSGQPLWQRADDVLRHLASAADGRLALIAAGGIATGADAYRAIRAGASLVQLYTALVYAGPTLPQTICRDLAVLLRRDGWASVAAARGR